MKDVSVLIGIAEALGMSDVVADLQAVEARSKQEHASVVLPLVGEFSSGKTTLINALTDSKALETATKPTTATIYEVHFGSERCAASVIDAEGHTQAVDDLSTLKNDVLADAQVVVVNDTSKRVPATTVLVDTPGLSSPDPKHKQTLMRFLPKADGLLLVTDINQQLTKSLTDFIGTAKLSKRPIYLILTKSDTKSATDIEAAKQYISQNCEIPIAQMAVVSSATGALDEMYALLDGIQRDKKDILARVDAERVKQMVQAMAERVDELMQASASDEALDRAIRQSQHELERIHRNIENLIDAIADDVEAEERQVVRQFEDQVFDRLMALVSGKSDNFDAEATALVNSTATLLMSEYQDTIYQVLRDKARSQRGRDGEVSLRSLESIDLSGMNIPEFAPNLGLNTMGHEYDGMIKAGLAVAAVAAVATVAAPAIAGAGAAGAATTAATSASMLNTAINVADTATDVASIVSNAKTLRRIEALSALERINTLPQTSGIIDSIIGLATDKLFAKPQRQRAVRNYIDATLVPSLKTQMSTISRAVKGHISTLLKAEAESVIASKSETLTQLKNEKQTQAERFNQRMEQLKGYKTTLLTL